MRRINVSPLGGAVGEVTELYGMMAGMHHVGQALAGTLFTWAMTAAGAAVVFWTRRVRQQFLDAMLGFAGGVMLAASFWSLLLPAVELAESSAAWFPAAAGFALGGLFMLGVDRLLPHLHPNARLPDAEGINPSVWKRRTLLVLAITPRNTPEGLAVGVAFGAQADRIGLDAAIALAIGMGIQNVPEGLAVALPLRAAGFSRTKSFGYGQMSGMVEPVAAVLGALAVAQIGPLLPYALGFAAGAMIFVTVEEVIPASQENGHRDLAAVSLMGGFVLMTVLDVALGRSA